MKSEEAVESTVVPSEEKICAGVIADSEQNEPDSDNVIWEPACLYTLFFL